MNHISIKKIKPEDVRDLSIISKTTFLETYADNNTKEDMKEYIEENFSLNKLFPELIDENSEFYFAVFDNNIAGYLKLNFGVSQTEIKESNSLEIERIYVLKEFQGKKIGQLFYETAIQVAKQKGIDYIWLGVWEKNLKAIGFYKKNGFFEFDKHIFKLGNDKQTDILMKLILKDN